MFTPSVTLPGLLFLTPGSLQFKFLPTKNPGADLSVVVINADPLMYRDAKQLRHGFGRTDQGKC